MKILPYFTTPPHITKKKKNFSLPCLIHPLFLVIFFFLGGGLVPSSFLPHQPLLTLNYYSPPTATPGKVFSFICSSKKKDSSHTSKPFSYRLVSDLLPTFLLQLVNHFNFFLTSAIIQVVSKVYSTPVCPC